MKNSSCYDEMIKNGVNPKLADMLASRQPPGASTDREFLHGYCNGNQFERNRPMGDYYASVAKQHKVDITGKVYMSGLAAFPGDPKAWVSSRADAAKVLDERGWGSDGAVSRPVRNKADKNRKDIADDIVRENVEKQLEGKVVSKREIADTIEKTKSSLKGSRKRG